MKHKLIDYTYSTGDMFIGKGERKYYFTPEERNALSIERCKIYLDMYIVFYNDKPLLLLEDDRPNNRNAYAIKYAMRNGTPEYDKEIIKMEMEIR